MSWNPYMEVHCINSSYPYNTAGSLLEYFEGLTYQHVNFIFSGASHTQDSVYPQINTGLYKYGFSDSGTASYYDYNQADVVHAHDYRIHDHSRTENSPILMNGRSSALNTEWEGNVNTTTRGNYVERPRRHHSNHDYQVAWQDNIDPDSMSYEELLELGETVGAQSRGLSQQLIALLPISKYKCCFFSRKKSRDERCVICQMEYKRRDRRITLPCNHRYHAGCGTKWLSINRACPICYREVFGDASKH